MEAYEIDIAKLSRDSGQRPETPPPAAKPDSSDDSHSEPEGDSGNSDLSSPNTSPPRQGIAQGIVGLPTSSEYTDFYLLSFRVFFLLSTNKYFQIARARSNSASSNSTR